MRRSIYFFLALLLILHAYLLHRPSVVPLVEATIAINAAACFWFVWNSFAKASSAVPLKPWVRAAVVILLLTLDSVTFMGAYMRLRLGQQPVITLEQPTPPFGWTAFDGGAHSVKELSGHVVVLHFWGTWCIPCRVEFPKLVAFAAKHPEVEFLAVDSHDDSEKADAFVAKSGTEGLRNFHFARDPEGALGGDTFKLLSFPTTILIDKNSQMRVEFARAVNWDGEDIDGRIAALQATR